MMDIETFAAMTRRIIARDGFDDFLPTACYPCRKIVSVLEGIPDGVDVERATWDWARRRAEDGEEFLIAFKWSTEHFKVVRRVNGEVEEAICPLIQA